MNSYYIKSFLFVIVIQFLFWGTVIAQSKLNTTISGKVFDKSTQQPLEYATITLISKQSGKVVNGTVADIKGVFGISNIPFDTYQVKIEFMGYEKISLDDIILNSEKRSVTLGTIFLSPSMQNLKNVIITGDNRLLKAKLIKLYIMSPMTLPRKVVLLSMYLKKCPR